MEKIVEVNNFKIDNNLYSKTEDKIFNYPVVYILFNENKNPQAYIGETTQIKKRLQSHYKNKERRGLKKGLIIYDKSFNKSATYNIETNLINYFISEQKYTLQNKSQISSNIIHDYYNKKHYNEKLFEDLWKQLQQRNIVEKSILELRNSDIFKISPFKSLTYEQNDIQKEIIEFINESIRVGEKAVLLINGEAGTGKSVLLSSTFKLINDLSKDSGNLLTGKSNNYVLVNHTEMLKTYQKVAKQINGIYVKDFIKPTTFVNNKEKKGEPKADVVLVDEAHLLLTEKSSYTRFDFDNHLEKIIEHSDITICFYDKRQILRANQYWDEEIIERIKHKHNTKEFEIKTQMRINASEKSVDWINNFIYGKIDKIPYDNKYDIEIVNSFEELHNTIKGLNQEDKLSRVVSTFDYVHKKDAKDYYVEDRGYRLPWNRAYKDTWAENVTTIDEVGSIYTIQGFDLNNVGVVLGPSVDYDEKSNKLVVNVEMYRDVGAFKGLGKLKNDESEKIKKEIILNSLNVLMKRGIKGLYLFAVNEKLQNKLKSIKKPTL